MNRVILMGRLCFDVELKTTPTGVPVLSNRIAVDRSYQTKGEDRKTDFLNIVAWRNTAEFISRWFAKGRLILVEGEIQTRHYTDKNQQEREIVEIVVDKAYFTGEKSADGANRSFALPPPPSEAPSYFGNGRTADGGGNSFGNTAAPAPGGGFGGPVPTNAPSQGGGFGTNNVSPFPSADVSGAVSASGDIAADDSEEYPF